MFSRLRVVHIAVKNLEEAVKLYGNNFGLQPSRSRTMPELGIRNASFPIGEAVIELIEPLDKEQGPIARFLQSRGEGVYMMALEVESIDSAIKSLSKRGVRLINTEPELRAKGNPVFIHPQSTKGVLVELVQKAPGNRDIAPSVTLP